MYSIVSALQLERNNSLQMQAPAARKICSGMLWQGYHSMGHKARIYTCIYKMYMAVYKLHTGRCRQEAPVLDNESELLQGVRMSNEHLCWKQNQELGWALLLRQQITGCARGFIFHWETPVKRVLCCLSLYCLSVLLCPSFLGKGMVLKWVEGWMLWKH